MNFLKIEAYNDIQCSIVLDNFSIHYNCQDEVTVTTTPDPLENICQGLPIEINYELCHTSGPATNLPVTVDFNVSPSNGLTVMGGGTQTFNLGGTNGSDNCHTLTLTLELDGSTPPATPYEITIEPLADNTCFNGLSESERTLTIDNITPLPDATFSPPMFSGCNAAFTSLPQTGSHLWAFSDGGTSTDANPTHLYTTGGTFTVTHTVTNACGSAVYSIPVTISCDPTFEYEAQNCSNLIHFTSAESGMHQWYVYDPQGTQVGQSTDQNFNFAFNGTGTFKVTLSINGGPSSEQFFTFIGTTTNSVTYASSFPAGVFSNQFVSFNGAFIVDVPSFLFENVDGRMIGGSTVVVNNGKSLRVSMSEFKSCDKMWKGFEALSGGSLAIVGSIVNDAQFAVKANGLANGAPGNMASISLNGNDFDRNFIGVYVPRGGSGKPQSVLFSGFSGNDFTCTTSLKPKYDGQDQAQANDTWIPLTGSWAYAGVWVAELAEMGIGAANGIKNTFDDLRNGICAERTELTVRNSTFKTMTIDQAYSGFPTGIGIYSNSVNGSSGSLTQTGLGDSGPTTFQFCEYGIRSRGTKVNISDNNMGKLKIGVSVEGCKLGNIVVSDNDISAFNVGVQLLHNGNASQTLSVLDNDIFINNQPGTVTSSLKWGIRMEDDDLAYAGASVNQNRVKLYSQNAIGIGLNAANGVNVNGNQVNIFVAGKATGISSSGGTNGTLEENTITGNGASSQNVGIFVDGTEGIRYCCNTMDETNIGISLQGDCDSPNKFQANHFYHHNTGLLVTPNSTTTVIGEQLHMGNQWHEFTQQIPVGALHLGGIQVAQTSIFRVNPNEPNYADLLPNVVNPQLWFDPNSTPNPNCSVMPTCGACNFNCFDGNPSEFEKRLAQNSPDVQNFNAVVKWQGERSLYHRLSENPAQMGSLLYLQNFYDQNTGTATGGFYSVDNGARNLFVLSSNQLVQLATNQASIESYQSQLTTKREALLNATPPQAAVLEAEMQALNLQLAIVVDANDQLVTGILSNIAQNALTVKTTNSSITATPVYQANEKTVNHILLDALANGGLDFSASLQTLQAIASQCPYVGGNAVFRARSMVALLDETASYDDAVLCHPNLGGQNLPPVAIKATGTAVFYPNPANDWLTVGYDFPDATSLTLVICNTNGMEVERIDLAIGGGSQSVPIEHLANGIYFCKILENGKSRIIGKIVILR